MKNPEFITPERLVPTPFAFGFGLIFSIILLFIFMIFVAIIIIFVYRWKSAKKEGLDPIAMDIQLAGQTKRSQLLAPAKEDNLNLTERLKELEDLKTSGIISEDEYKIARARILGIQD